MSERWWRRKRSSDSWIRDFFDESDSMEKMMDSMMRQAFGSPAEREKARRHYVNQFGAFHNHTHSTGAHASEEHEPLIDLFADESNVVIVAELLGINKEAIEVDATEDTVTISVDSSIHKYCQELKLPAKVDPKSSAASFKNGVLEVRLKKLLNESLFIK